MFYTENEDGKLHFWKTATIRPIPGDVNLQFSPLVRKQWYPCKVEGHTLALKFTPQSWVADLWKSEDGALCTWDNLKVIEPVVKVAHCWPDVAYLAQTGELLHITKENDGQHVICIDEDGDRYLVNCNMLVQRGASQCS